MVYFNKVCIFFILMLSLNLVDGYSQSGEIINYQVFYGIAEKDKLQYIIIRKYSLDKKEYFLLVDPERLDTRIVQTSECESIKTGFKEIENLFSGSVYFRTLKDASNNAKKMQDAGITHALPTESGIVLTIDLCPSKLPLDKKIITTLINAFQNIEKPVPIAIAISGHWMNEHPQDLEWLKLIQAKGEIDITWINHTLNHYYNKDLPLKSNFMLNKITDVNNEVLGNEKLMIKNGLEPSVFFRFPGLVSDVALLDSIYNYGLITIGSDAWLAKGDTAKKGSIVLIHGNGNEPIGVEKFIELINSNKPQEIKKSWLLFDLRESIKEEIIQE